MSSGSALAAKGNREIVFGMSSAFTGANAELGMEFYRGMMAYLQYFNSHGGAHGWTIRILPANDGYNPDPCFQNTVRFILDDRVFALASYVGTPTTARVLPLLQKFADQNILLLFPFTGAHVLRAAPYDRYVFNLRASYFDETAWLVNNLVDVGRRKICVFYQSDAYGRNGWDGVRRALKKRGLDMAASATYRRGATFNQDFTKEARYLMDADPDAIIVVGTYAPQAGFIRDARNEGCTVPICGLSFSDSDTMLDLLSRVGEKTGRDYTHDLINTQVVPNYRDERLPGVRLYRKLMDKYEGKPVIVETDYAPRRFGYVSLEGFLNGRLLGAMIEGMGENPSRERIPQVLESFTDLDLGIGPHVHFGPGDHQGLDTVYLTTFEDGKPVELDNLERWRK